MGADGQTFQHSLKQKRTIPFSVPNIVREGLPDSFIIFCPPFHPPSTPRLAPPVLRILFCLIFRWRDTLNLRYTPFQEEKH